MLKKIYFPQNVMETDVSKKRKNDTEDEGVVKRRKVEVDNGDSDDSDDICIISNDDTSHDNSSELKKPTRKRKLSDDVDCLIVCDDD